MIVVAVEIVAAVVVQYWIPEIRIFGRDGVGKREKESNGKKKGTKMVRIEVVPREDRR